MNRARIFNNNGFKPKTNIHGVAKAAMHIRRMHPVPAQQKNDNTVITAKKSTNTAKTLLVLISKNSITLLVRKKNSKLL